MQNRKKGVTGFLVAGLIIMAFSGNTYAEGNRQKVDWPGIIRKGSIGKAIDERCEKMNIKDHKAQNCAKNVVEDAFMLFRDEKKRTDKKEFTLDQIKDLSEYVAKFSSATMDFIYTIVDTEKEYFDTPDENVEGQKLNELMKQRDELVNMLPPLQRILEFYYSVD
jgi:hypothetical protein